MPVPRSRLCTGSVCAVLVSAFVAVASWMVVGEHAAAQPTPSNRLALVGGTVYVDPRATPIREGVVLIEDDHILAVGPRTATRVPSGFRTIDCSGFVITAGFWNSHVHFLQRKWANAGTVPASALARQLQSMLTQYGFTSVFDTWSAWVNTRRIRDRIESGEVPGPRIHSTGEAILGSGVTTTPESWAALGFMPQGVFQIPRVATDADAVAASAALLNRGVDALKFYAATPGRNSVVMPESMIRAGVEAAHAVGKLVFVHPTSEAGLMASVGSGADIIAHTTPQSGAWSERTLSQR